MRPFDLTSGIAAPLPMANIDTDKIIPARFLKTIHREGLGKALFHTMRFAASGEENPDFILNVEPWRGAEILVTRDNFGCGSSREHAPWALADFGIRCIIAPSFADIFHNNCFKNGILPITIRDEALIERLLAQASDPETARIRIDLAARTIQLDADTNVQFDIPPERQRALLLGLDDIDATLAHSDEITRFENGRGDTPPRIPDDTAAQVEHRMKDRAQWAA